VWTEGTDKTRKILEIWRKNSTFATHVLDEVEGLVKAFEGAGAKRLLPGLERLVSASGQTAAVNGGSG
nr:hypothetical protein [Tanacetum cinerariifolium]